MNRPATYNTRQRAAVLDYVASLDGEHVTAAQIAAHFSGNDTLAIGRTTVYRLLDKLTAEGILRRYTSGGVSGACYQHTGGGADCRSHFHLKCGYCGVISHFECVKMDEIREHIKSEHSFQIDAGETVLYGKCGDCLHKNG